MQIYVNLTGQPMGPFTQEQVLEMLAAGRLTPEDQCAVAGGSEWVPIREFFRRQGMQSLPTPHGVVSASRPRVYAGFWIRVGAYLIDGMVIGVPFYILQMLLFPEPKDLHLPNGQLNLPRFMEYMQQVAPLNALNFLAAWLYTALMTSSAKQATVGKLVCGLRVTDLKGERISFGRATGRWFAELLSGALFCIGFIMCAFTARKQCLHDMLAGTLVEKKSS